MSLKLDLIIHIGPFSRKIDEILSVKHSNTVFDKNMRKLYKKYHRDILARSILLNIEKNKQELLGYRGITQAPMTTNLMVRSRRINSFY